jgi:hypothetical protein
MRTLVVAIVGRVYPMQVRRFQNDHMGTIVLLRTGAHGDENLTWA